MVLEDRMVAICGERKTGGEHKRCLPGALGNIFLHLGARTKGIWSLGEKLPSRTLMMCAGFCRNTSTFLKSLSELVIAANK